MPKPFFNEVAGLCNFIKFFFAKFVRTPFLTEHLRWLLLTLKSAFEICQLPFFIRRDLGTSQSVRRDKNFYQTYLL